MNELESDPFIKGTWVRWAWDSTILGSFKKCPYYYKLKFIDGWQKDESIHLRWGSEFHKAMEDYEWSKINGVKHDDAVFDVLKALLERIEDWQPDPRTPSEEKKSKVNLVRAVIWQLDTNKDDKAKTVMLPDGTPAVEVTFKFEAGFGPDGYGRPYEFCGHLDKLVEFNGDIFVMDYKSTGGTIGSSYFAQYDMDNQMTLYTIAGQVVYETLVKGVIVNAVQVAQTFIRPGRGITYRTQDNLEEWVEDTRIWLRQAEGYAKSGHWPMNDTSCDKYGGCEFREVCSRSPHVREQWLKANFEKREPWNPLLPRGER